MDMTLFFMEKKNNFQLTQTSTQIWYLHALKKHRIWTERSGFSYEKSATDKKGTLVNTESKLILFRQ